jgi:hypothetical protein
VRVCDRARARTGRATFTLARCFRCRVFVRMFTHFDTLTARPPFQVGSGSEVGVHQHEMLAGPSGSAINPFVELDLDKFVPQILKAIKTWTYSRFTADPKSMVCQECDAV